MIDLEMIRGMAEELYPKLVEIRRHLHKNPELSQRERNTQIFIMDILQKAGISCYRIADTGVLAVIEGRGKGKTVGLRGDMDALPMTEVSSQDYSSVNEGVMHACGHDAHTTILLGAGLVFQKMRDKFDGTVKLFFQPAEETVGGAARMVKEGCMENPKVDYVLGLHVMPYLPHNSIEIKYGTLNASTDTLLIKVGGKSGHGAYPEQGVDAVAIACQMVVAAQTIVSRNISPLDSAVFTVGKIQGGTKANIIADKVEMEATVRSSSLRVKELLMTKIRKVMTGVAEAMGGSCEIISSEDGYPSLVNNDEIVDIVKECGKTVVGFENVFEKKQASMGGEDFSFFIKNVPGAFYHIGCRMEGREPYNIHTNSFDIDERCLKTGVIMQVNTALTLMNK